MNLVFLDTAYLIALETADDQYHTIAETYWKSITNNLPEFITTTYVFDETVTFFNRRHQHRKAVEVGNQLLESTILEIIEVDRSIFSKGWNYFCRHSDKRYSLTDCISFICMNGI